MSVFARLASGCGSPWLALARRMSVFARLASGCGSPWLALARRMSVFARLASGCGSPFHFGEDLGPDLGPAAEVIVGRDHPERSRPDGPPRHDLGRHDPILPPRVVPLVDPCRERRLPRRVQ